MKRRSCWWIMEPKLIYKIRWHNFPRKSSQKQCAEFSFPCCGEFKTEKKARSYLWNEQICGTRPAHQTASPPASRPASQAARQLNVTCCYAFVASCWAMPASYSNLSVQKNTKRKMERRLSWRRRRHNIRLGKENVLVSKVGLEGPEPFLDVSRPNLT